MRIRNLESATAQVLFAQKLLPGPQIATWSGLDAAGKPLPGALYWVTFESDTETRRSCCSGDEAARQPSSGRGTVAGSD